MPSQQVLDESQLSVVALPPTPLKTVNDDTNTSPSSSSPEEVVSSQILPLHRLSGSTLPHVNKSSSNNPSSVQNKSKPVAEVSPFSNNQEQDANVTTTAPALDDTDLGYQRVPNNSIMDTSAALTPTISTQTPNNTLILRRQTSVINETVEDDTTEEVSENKNKSPVKDKLQKMRRSITEPLIQYFHDITLVSCKHIKHCLLTLFIIAEFRTRGAWHSQHS